MSMRRNFLIKLATEITAKGLLLFATLYYARSLGKESWGAMQLSLSVAMLAGMAADLGLSGIVGRRIIVSAAAERRRALEAAWMLKVLLWAMVLAVYVPWALWRGHAGLLLSAALLTLATSLSEFNGRLFGPLERLDLEFKVNTTTKLGQSLAGIAALMLGAGPLGLMLSMAVATWLGWIWGFSVQWRELGRHQPLGHRASIMRELLIELWPYGLTPAIILAYNKVDSLLLAHYSGVAAVGTYQLAYKWLEHIAFIPTAFIAASFPAMVRNEAGLQGSDKRLKVLFMLLSLGAVAAAGLYGMADWLPWMVGPQYSEAVPLLRALAPAVFFSFANYALYYLVLAGKKQGSLLYTVLAALAFNAALNVALMPAYGALAAAWVTVATEAMIFAALAFVLRKVLPITLWAVGLLKAMALVVIGFALASFSGSWGLIIGPLSVMLLALLTGLVPRDEWQRLKSKIREKLT